MTEIADGESASGAAPKHVAIREYVRDLLADCVPGSPAPSERDLTEKFGVARMTVRHALDALVKEGLLERFPGRGTFVARPRRVRSRVSGMTEDLRRRGMIADSQTVVAHRWPASQGVARALHVEPETPVIRWRRLRLADGRPVALTDTFLNESLLPGFLDAPLPVSLYVELARRGRRPTWSEDSVTAGAASPVEARLLELDAASPVLRYSRCALWEEQPVEYSRSTCRSDARLVMLQLEG